MKSWAIWLSLILALSISRGNAAPATSLPSAPALMEKVLHAAQKENIHEKAFREGYAGYRVRVLQEFNGKGEVTKTNHNKRPFYPGSRTDNSRSHAGGSTNQASYKQSDFTVTKELVDRFTFEVAGRENLAGRSVVVLNFQPAAKKLPVNGIKDKFINNMAGRLWVDEEDFLIAKAELRLRSQVNIAGGLAGAVKQFQYQFERTRTQDGVWYLKRSVGRIEAREFLSQKRIAFEEHTENVIRVKKTLPRG